MVATALPSLSTSSVVSVHCEAALRSLAMRVFTSTIADVFDTFGQVIKVPQ